ncbi:hypothetical protein PITC_082110 [Penicillium italicum]|uniref:Uncharacterized protein n=1 Tax=Penicillium italicum TaxID=40296 RepID=A0A0A2L676_PENIT|nr:hypothetical protein PITC_082110 [Penicillium italicum]
MSLSSLGILFLNKKKESQWFFFPSLAQFSVVGGLDQQSADWPSITTSVQTPSDRDANLPFLAQCGGSRDAVEHVSVGVCLMLVRYLAFKRNTSINL